MTKNKKRKATEMKEKPRSQIARLATFIQDEIPGVPFTSEGAVDVAIRLLRNAYGHEGLSIPDLEATGAVDRMKSFLSYVPIDELEKAGQEFNPVDTAINLLMVHYPNAHSS